MSPMPTSRFAFTGSAASHNSGERAILEREEWIVHNQCRRETRGPLRSRSCTSPRRRDMTAVPTAVPHRSEAAEYYFTYIDQVPKGDVCALLETHGAETL